MIQYTKTRTQDGPAIHAQMDFSGFAEGFGAVRNTFLLIRNGCASGTRAFTRAQKEKRFSTNPMGNAGVGTLPRAWACRAAPQNLLDLAFVDKRKNKTKRFR
ncbi:hypothetical protein LCGC14_1487640 [marine sediment metagenome]|uniref:Uncharacterized protein n=2 Tax=root TaxID=1 RepID=A0A831VUI2_9FLAO|nr:hypothetical protein [Pricia antarctica]